MMIATTRKQKKYDHRLKDVIRATGRTDLVRQHEVPESTARGRISACCASAHSGLFARELAIFPCGNLRFDEISVEFPLGSRERRM